MSWKRLQDKGLQERLKVRARIVQMIREFFIKEGFLEVETPILVPAAGQEPYLNPMRVEFTTPNPSSERRGSESISSPFQGEVGRGYLITSPEYAHKKLLAAGFDKTFEITRAFRAGEPWGGLHNPEFTILEWYRANADYRAIMDDVEKMVQFVYRSVISTKRAGRARGEISSAAHMQGVRSLAPTTSVGARDDRARIGYQGKVIDLSSPWQRLTMCEAWEQYVPGFKCTDLLVRANLCTLAKRRGYKVSTLDSYDDIFFKIFLTEIEPKLGQSKPTILYDYPASMASLARLKPSPPPQSSPLKGEEEKGNSPPLVGGARGGGVAERFEVYIAGIELGNAFSELNDGAEQRKRFMEERALRKKLDKEIIPLDEDFLDAVGNMPPSAGIALGIDRLVMLLTNAVSIEDVLAFPAKDLVEGGWQ